MPIRHHCTSAIFRSFASLFLLFFTPSLGFSTSMLDTLVTVDHETLTISSNQWQDAFSRDNSFLTIQDGTLIYRLTQSSGNSTLQFEGGETDLAEAIDFSTFNWLGGTINYYIETSGSSIFNYHGGTLGNGSGYFFAEGNSTLNFYGYDFGTYSAGQLITLTDLGSDPSSQGITLSITMADNSVSSFKFKASDTWAGSLNLVAIPEPTTYALWIGAILFTGICWKRKTSIS